MNCKFGILITAVLIVSGISVIKASEKTARIQPLVPQGWKEIKYETDVPEPVLTEQEKEQGFMLFARPITDPVYPATRPFEYERIDSLNAFATLGEVEPISFCIYPLRDLKNTRVVVSSLVSGNNAIPSSAIETRLVTYWNMRYPAYTSADTYMRVPTLVENITVNSSPAKECQRYWMKIYVPVDAKAGIYSGTVTIADEGYDKPISIPLVLRVMDFKLKKDPKKHFTAYYYSKDKEFIGINPDSVEKATLNEYRSMVEYGFDVFPTIYLDYDNGKNINIRFPEEIDKMKKAGMNGFIPAVGDHAIKAIYAASVPDGKVGAHWKLSKMPDEGFYKKITGVFAAFEKERKAKNMPEFIVCPVDEIDSAHSEFGVKLFAAIKSAGMKTYITKDPNAVDAAKYAPYVDYWCSQPYSKSYDEIVSQAKYGYWSYPNHNAGENKNPLIMCKGGRMTYGFGFWRSGYSTLMPWHWRDHGRKNFFDHLENQSFGQHMDENGEIIPVIHWECFREGYDDGRYIYTLESAIAQREGSKEPGCGELVIEGKRLLQEIWGAIKVQSAYTNKNLWSSEDFNAYRWRLAELTEKLYKFKPVNNAEAPSVLVGDTKQKLVADEEKIDSNNIVSFDLGDEDFSKWESISTEGKIEVKSESAHKGSEGFRYEVLVDHFSYGGGEISGSYPIGWPRMRINFPGNGLDITKYDYLTFWVKIDSNRDEVADDFTPAYVSFLSYKSKGPTDKTLDLGAKQRDWVPVKISINDLVDPNNKEPWTSISYIQFGIAEGKYAHGTKMIFDLDEIMLMKLKTPVVSEINAPRQIFSSAKYLPVSFKTMGMKSVKKGSYFIKAELVGQNNKKIRKSSQDLTESEIFVMDIAGLTPGKHTLNLSIIDKIGKVSSTLTSDIMVIEGPY